MRLHDEGGATDLKVDCEERSPAGFLHELPGIARSVQSLLGPPDALRPCERAFQGRRTGHRSGSDFTTGRLSDVDDRARSTLFDLALVLIELPDDVFDLLRRGEYARRWLRGDESSAARHQNKACQATDRLDKVLDRVQVLPAR